jgi:hypothetical protein
MATKIMHDFMNHDHGVCVSKVESHIHEKELNCDLHLIKQNNLFLVSEDYQILHQKNDFQEINSEYHFLKNHYKLSFSLRGPPTFS